MKCREICPTVFFPKILSLLFPEQKMFEFEHLLDVNHLYTNNIHQVAQMYGIEAAQRSVIRELRAVQSAYDIKVR